jgi:hypothetical protein
VKRSTVVVLAAASLAAAPWPAQAAAPHAPYEATPAAVQDAPTYAVRYTGSSHTRTRYRGTPPNAGGDPDHNAARDTSRTGWALTFRAPLAIPTCGGEPDPCASVAGASGASGRTSASGTIDHQHRDGLYRQLDASERCSVAARGLPRTGLQARIDVVFDAARGGFVVTARNPVSLALILLPPVCPGHTDGIDRILDNYFTPGFSFSQDYGADRWFTSASVLVPTDAWHASSRIRLRLGPTAAGRPPADCAKRYRYEHCRTGGSWSGVLTFTRR